MGRSNVLANPNVTDSQWGCRTMVITALPRAIAHYGIRESGLANLFS
jgi:hypothetical protein